MLDLTSHKGTKQLQKCVIQTTQKSIVSCLRLKAVDSLFVSPNELYSPMNHNHSSKPKKQIPPVLGRTQWARALAYLFGSLLTVSALPPEM
ncbi:MAG: hypothetical protein ACE1Y4_08725, partial [Lysobacterales bacterium]